MAITVSQTLVGMLGPQLGEEGTVHNGLEGGGAWSVELEGRAYSMGHGQCSSLFSSIGIRLSDM